MHDNVVYPRADSPTQQQQQVMVIHVRPNEPGTDAAPHTFTTEMIMACFVLWCCNCAFGVIAFILASQYTNFVPHSFHRVIHKIIPFVWNVLVIVIFSNQNKENNRVSAFLTQKSLLLLRMFYSFFVFLLIPLLHRNLCRLLFLWNERHGLETSTHYAEWFQFLLEHYRLEIWPKI